MTPSTYSPKPQRKLRQVLLPAGCLAGVVCLCLTAFAAAGFFWYSQGEPIRAIQQLLGVRSEPRAAEFVPPDAQLFVSFNPSFADLASFAKLRRIFEKNPVHAQHMNEIAQQFTPGYQVKFENDVLPWVGTEAAIVLLAGAPDAGSPAAPDVVFLATTRDPAQSDAAIARVRQGAETKGWTFTTETYQASSIVSSRPPAQTTQYYQAYRGGAYTTFQGWVLYGASAAAIKKVIDTKLAGEAASLKHSDPYRAALGKLPNERAATLYLNLDAKSAAAQAQFGLGMLGSFGAGAFENVQALALSAAFTDDGIRFDYISVFDAKRTPAAFKTLVTTYKPNAGRAFEHIPDASLFALSGQDMRAQWNYHSDIARSDPQLKFQDNLDAERTRTGIDVESDVFAWLDGEYALSVVPAGSGVSALAVVAVQDEALVAAKMDKLIQAYFAKPVSLRSLTIRGVAMQVVAPPKSDEITFGYGFVDHYLVIGNSNDALSMAVDAGKSPLSRSAEFQGGNTVLPRPNIGVSYLSIPRLVDALTAMGFGPSEDVLSVLAPFKSVSISFGVPQNDSQAGVLFVHVGE